MMLASESATQSSYVVNKDMYSYTTVYQMYIWLLHGLWSCSKACGPILDLSKGDLQQPEILLCDHTIASVHMMTKLSFLVVTMVMIVMEVLLTLLRILWLILLHLFKKDHRNGEV